MCYKKVIELLEKEIKSFFLSIYVYYYCQMATKFFGYKCVLFHHKFLAVFSQIRFGEHRARLVEQWL